ncbi:hypothetical protein SSS_03501, partial [Sarcoptes scabiei]
ITEFSNFEQILVFKSNLNCEKKRKIPAMSNRSVRGAIVYFGSQNKTTFSSREKSSSNRKRGKRDQNETIHSEPNTSNMFEIDENVPIEANDEEISLELDVLINNCVRLILLNEHHKTVIKQADINRFLSENHRLKRDQINNLMRKVSERLWNDFGFRLIPINDLATKSFILHTPYRNDLLCLDEKESENFRKNSNEMNDLDDDIRYETITKEIPLFCDKNGSTNSDQILLPPNTTYDDALDLSKRALLLTILSLIFLDESQQLSEMELFQNLEEIGFDLDAKYEIAHVDCEFFFSF